MNQGLMQGLIPALESGLNPSWSKGFDFSSPNNYETDYWDMQTQTVAGKYDNGVGSATLDNTGGLPDETVILDGNPYNVWESDDSTDLLTASSASAGDSDNEDFSFRIVLTLSTPASGVKSIFGKIISGASPGWICYFIGNTVNFYLDDGSAAPTNFSASADLSGGDVHVISGWYDSSADMAYLKSDAFAEVSVSTATLTGSMATTQVVRVGASHIDTVAGIQNLFDGICVGANAQAYYDEIVTLPA